jgi:hypothetical protein
LAGFGWSPILAAVRAQFAADTFAVSNFKLLADDDVAFEDEKHFPS